MEANQPLNEVPIYKGFLYRISDSAGKERGHLAGSIHTAVDPNYTLHPLMEAAFQKTNTVFIEVNPLLLPECQAINRAIIFNKASLNEPIEHKVLKMAFGKKTIVQLETFEEQKQLLNQMPGSEEQKKNIVKSLTGNLKIQELELPEADRIELLAAKDRMEKVAKGYKAGNKSDVKPLFMLGDETLQKNSFWDRNLKMANKIDEFLQKQDPLFVLIGTGHLWGTKEEGKKGVVALLRDKVGVSKR